MNVAIPAAAVVGILVVSALLTAPVIAWIDRRTHGITATRSRANSSVQCVVTTVAFAVAYAIYPSKVPGIMVASGIALLFGLALGGEIQAERLHRMERSAA